MGAYSDLIAASPAAGTDRSTPLGELLWGAAYTVVAARKDLDQKLAGLARDVTEATERHAAGGTPHTGNFGSHGAAIDIAIVKLQAAQNAFAAIAGTISETRQATSA